MAALSLACDKRVARRLGAWICFADESGITLRPARARTWAPRGETPVVSVAGRGGRKPSIAGIAAYRSGQRSRPVYRIMIHRGHKGEPRSFGEAHFAVLLDNAHQQPGEPIALVWDGLLPAHRPPRMRALVAARPWLRVYQLPDYAPELNPTENIRSSMKRHGQPRRRHHRRPDPHRP